MADGVNPHSVVSGTSGADAQGLTVLLNLIGNPQAQAAQEFLAQIIAEKEATMELVAKNQELVEEAKAQQAEAARARAEVENELKPKLVVVAARDDDLNRRETLVLSREKSARDLNDRYMARAKEQEIAVSTANQDIARRTQALDRQEQQMNKDAKRV
jgi:hypothetical protein